MVIEFKHMPPMGALGQLAYQVGAGEAARKREEEERARQMQLLQMQQRTQEANLSRSMDAWRTQYQHTSAMQKMQADQEYQDSSQRRAQEYGRDIEGYRADLRLEGSKELDRLRAADAERMAQIDHINRTAENEQRHKQAGDQARAKEAATENRIYRSQYFSSLGVAGQTAYTEIQGQISDVNADDRISDEKKREQVQQLREQQLKLHENEAYQKKPWEQGYHKEGDLWNQNNYDGSGVTWSLSESATLEKWKTWSKWKPEIIVKDGERYETTAVMRPNERTHVMEVDTSGLKHIGPTTEKQQERQQGRNDRRRKLSGEYFKVDMVKEIDQETGLESVVQRVSLTSAGLVDAHKFGMSGLDPNNRGQQAALISAGMEEYYREAEEADGGPGVWDSIKGLFQGSGQGDPSGGPPVGPSGPIMEGVIPDVVSQTTAAPTGTEGLPGGIDPQVLNVIQESYPPGSPERKFVEEIHQGAPLTPQLIEKANLFAEQAREKKETQVRDKVYKRPQPTPFEAAGMRREATADLAYSDQGHRGELPPEWEGITSVSKRKDPPEVLAKPVEKYLGVQEAGLGFLAEQVYERPKRQLQTLLKGAVPPQVKLEREKAASKREDSMAVSVKKQEAIDKAVSEKMNKAVPGMKVPTPKAYSSLKLDQRTVSKSFGKEKYNEFYKELRGYVRRLVNDENASKDTKMRLDRIMGKQPSPFPRLTGKGGVGITREELKDEIRVIKMVGRAADASKPFFLTRNKVWKDFLSKDLSERKQLVYLQVHGDALVDSLKDAGF